MKTELEPLHKLVSDPADSVDESVDGNRSADTIAASYIAQVETDVLRRPMPIWKRALDIIGVAILVPILIVPLLCVAIYIKLVSRGPIFFVQSRLGYGGADFAIFKFRTLHVVEGGRESEHRAYVASHAGVDGPVAKPDHSSNCIPGGAFLRATSIDELPQLINVLFGSMSLVGPRPDVLCREDYSPQQLRRFEVQPGMTGLWQVSGKNELSFDEMIQLDIRYIEERSLLRDIGIMLKTVKVLLTERNG
ncbi:MAG: sugar transferase [Pirellulaceae bacterium]